MLSLFRLHEKACTKGYSRYDRSGDKCNCPIHVEGKLGKEFVRSSTGTRAMTRARKMVVMAEERGRWDKELRFEDGPNAGGSRITIPEAIQAFLADAGSRKGKNLAAPSLSKYRTVLGKLSAFCEQAGVDNLRDVTYPVLAEFRKTWETGPQSTANYIATLRTFWRYAVNYDWTEKNIAKKLEMPRNYQFTERQPYSEVEMEQLLMSARTIPLDPQQPASNEEMECFLLLMRYAGMAIADATLFRPDFELKGDEVRYYRQKTRRRANRPLVIVPIPRFLVDRLQALPKHNGKYTFCHGSDRLVSACSAWHKRLDQIFEAAGVPNASSHRFRHTFATSLLSKGVSVEKVSRWLGHRSIQVTIRYYSHWIEDRIQAASDEMRELYAREGL